MKQIWKAMGVNGFCRQDFPKTTGTLSELYVSGSQTLMSEFLSLISSSIFHTINSEEHSTWVDMNMFSARSPEPHQEREIRANQGQDEVGMVEGPPCSQRREAMGDVSPHLPAVSPEALLI